MTLPAGVTARGRPHQTRQGPVLRLEPGPGFAADHVSGDDGRALVMDTTWSDLGRGSEGPIALRDVAARVLGVHDLGAEAMRTLDEWVAGSRVVEAMTVDGTSYWFYVRLRQWTWLQEQLLWLGVLDELVRELDPRAIVVPAGVGAEAATAARLIAARDGMPVDEDDAGPMPPGAPGAAATSAVAPGSSGASAGAGGGTDRLSADRSGPLDRVRVALADRLHPSGRRARHRFVDRRLGQLAREPGRLLVVLEHAAQRVERDGRTRLMNPYLGPVVDRLRGTRLEPLEIDIRARVRSDDTWQRLRGPDASRHLPADAIAIAASASREPAVADRPGDAAARIEGANVPAVAFGVDLGPTIAGRVADDIRRTLADQAGGAVRIRRLLRRLRPAGILLADEYHRQGWLAAASAEGIPTAAIQHGVIYATHPGYVHRERPPELRLPARTYVFGRWERAVLVERSVYGDEEVVVGGSPRLDLVAATPADREVVRAELGVRVGDRLLVLSGTWGPNHRRFHYPIALARLFDRPIPGVHLVVKLHPGEPDEGPYREVIEGVARAAGFAPPPITVVRLIDLYRLLGAADAHLGIQSTVLTEAVAAGTPNLLFGGFAGGDVVGYVDAGVAHPVHTGADLVEALDRGLGRASDETRRVFLESHFEPGSASERIAADLLAWL